MEVVKVGSGSRLLRTRMLPHVMRTRADVSITANFVA